MRPLNSIAFLAVVLRFLLCFCSVDSCAVAQTAMTPGQDLKNAELTGPSTVANDANLQQAIQLTEMWRMIAWLVMLLAAVIGAVLWAFGHRQVVFGVIGAAVILGGLFNFIAVMGAQSAGVGAGSQYYKPLTSPIANNAFFHPPPKAVLGQVAQTFFDDGIRVFTTVIPLCLMAFGLTVLFGSLFYEGLLMRFLPVFILASVLLFANQTLATFFTGGVFPSSLPNDVQLVSVTGPTDSDIKTYSAQAAAEPPLDTGNGSPAAFSLSSGMTPHSTLPSDSSFTLGSGVASGPMGGIGSLGNNVLTHSDAAVIDSDGDPTAQRSWDWAWQSTTSSGYNSATTPFVVATPQEQSQQGVQMGDWAQVTNNATGQTTWARVGDSGNTGEYGEISEAAATAVGIHYNSLGTVGNPSVTVRIFPGTKNLPNMSG
jgi:hypothetical protein